MELLTASNITFGLVVIGTMFGIYKYFKDPQTNEEKKSSLLAQQVQWQVEGSDRRFSEVQASIKDAFLLAQNHTHTVETKVDALVITVSTLANNLTRLETIIDERIPKK